MSRGFVCDSCGEAQTGEPMLEIAVSVSAKAVDGHGRRDAHEKERHYCSTCTDMREFDSHGYQKLVTSLVHRAIAASPWEWGTP